MLLAGPAAATLIATLPEVNTNVEFYGSLEAGVCDGRRAQPLTSGHRSIYCQR
jgi:hypothetical protein